MSPYLVSRLFLLVFSAAISLQLVAQKDSSRRVITKKPIVVLPKGTRVLPQSPVIRQPVPTDPAKKPAGTSPAAETVVPNIVYVKANATGANDGSSWTNAFTKLESALAVAVAGKTIWVAAGIYKPTTTLDRTRNFALKNRVSLYGSFAGRENSMAERRFAAADSSFLDGDIGMAGNHRDNSYNILFAKGLDNTTIIDGFIIRYAVADQGTQVKIGSSGAAIFIDGSAGGTSPVFRNCQIRNNSSTWGGAVMMSCLFRGGGDNGGGNPVFERCSFTGNTAYNKGGSIYIDGGAYSFNPRFVGCNFYYNKGPEGGAVFHTVVAAGSAPVFDNCLFHGNRSGMGAAICNMYGSSDASVSTGDARPLYKKCIFRNNDADGFGQGTILTNTYARSFTMEVKDCIFEYSGTSSIITKFSQSGGAFYNNSLQGGSLVLNVSNSIFNKMQCGGSGGVIFNYARGGTNITANFRHCLFAESYGCEGGVLYGATDENPASRNETNFYNSIFWYNYFQTRRADGSCGKGEDISLASSQSVATLSHCLTNKADCTVMKYGAGTLTCTDMLFATDPLFVDAANKNFNLQAGSPAKEAGNNSFAAGIVNDIAGNKRKSGTNVDIGPYEIK